mmetsp:Transcript_90101/g.226769  ORF Transcript_90101/g.226769 Transcript_90101/m.226769 type:complete len:297 (+) Transcript_90101:82-972(+)
MRVTSLNPKLVIKVGGVLAVGLAILGCCVQDWTCRSKCGAATEWSGDNTWGTCLTYYVLAVMAAIMATLAPSGDGVKSAMRGAFSWLVVAWLIQGVVQSFLPPDGESHKYMWILSLVCLAVGGLWRVYAALVAAQKVGYITQWTDHQSQLYIFASISAAYVVIIFASYLGHISIPDLLMYTMHESTFCLLLCVVAAFSEEIRWAVACLLTYGLVIYIRKSQPYPFKISTKFNDTALMNCALMGYLVATFGLLFALHSKQNTFYQIEQKADGMMDKCAEGAICTKPGRGCCVAFSAQ